MKLKDLIAQYGEYEVDLKKVVGKSEIESVVIDLTKPKPKSVWDLEQNDEYFVATDTGGTMCCQVRRKEIFEKAREAGNAFLTKEEAEKESERRKVEALLLKYGGRRQIKEHWDNWCILFSDNAIIFEVECEHFIQGSIYFDTYEEAKIAVAKIGEERIKDALFEVR